MRVLFVFNHQAPYKVRLFNELSKEIEVTALFERLKDSDRDPRFYNCNDIKFKPTYIKGLNLGHDNHLSRGIVKHLMNNEYDIVVMNGWHTFSEMMAINHLKKHGKSYVFYINGGIINIKESRIMHKIKTHYISGASLYFSPDENSNKYLIHYGAEPEKIINYPYSTIYEKEILNNPPIVKSINTKYYIDKWDELDVENKKKFAQAYIEKIKFYRDNKIEITFK